MAGTGNHAGASPSRSAGHRQDRVGCIVECDQPKGEQKGAYSLQPRQPLSVYDYGINYRGFPERTTFVIVLPRTHASFEGMRK